MALMLRQTCQDALNRADLDAYHADMDPCSKLLTLYTPCGKQFAVVHGVQFSRLHPTQAENDYAVELLTHWLDRNEKKIENYIDAFETVQRLGDPKPKLLFKGAEITVALDQDRTYNHSRNEWVTTLEVGDTTVDYNGVTYRIDENGDLASIIWKDGLPKPWGKTIGLPADIRAAAKERMEEMLLFRSAKKISEEILGELNTCRS